MLAITIICLGVKPRARIFKDDQGKVIPGSIALLEELEINGMKQWVSIRGRDKANPVLLWLHGGPGSTQMAFSHYLDGALEEEFVVVHWDQRGAGKSNHSGFREETMTVQQYKEDALVLINYLLEKLGQEKIYLLGHSWGTQIGLELVHEHPEFFHAYIAVSQVVDHTRAVEMGIDWLRQEMQANKDQKGLELLDSIENPAYNHSDYRKFAKLATSYGGNYDKSLPELALIAFKAPEYTFIDYFRLLNGMNRGGKPLHANSIITQYNYIDSIPEIDVPIYFLIGLNDRNTPYALVEEYYSQIKAPFKRLIVFENSAHTPFLSESDKFNEELISILGE